MLPIFTVTDVNCVFGTDKFCQSQKNVYPVIKKHFKTILKKLFGDYILF